MKGVIFQDMKNKFSLMMIFLLMLSSSCSYSSEMPGIKVVSVEVEGNERISAEDILDLANTKPGEILSNDVIESDIEAIYSQGFFSYVDADVKPEGEGAAVVFSVKENPIIESVNFSGNSLYTSEQLMNGALSQVGTVFNRKFLRKDLERIQDKYSSDGYVMARVSDVKIEGGNLYVTILEPAVRNITVTGLSEASSPDVLQEIKGCEGKAFDINFFRRQILKLDSSGYYEDINIAFDTPESNDAFVDITITLKTKGESTTSHEE